MKLLDYMRLKSRKKIRDLLASKYPSYKDDAKLDKYLFALLYQKKRLIGEHDFYKIVAEDIRKNNSVMYGRLGYTEAYIVGEYIEKRMGKRTAYSPKWVEWLYKTSGFFGEKENIDRDVDRYAQLTLDAVQCCDYFACWHPAYIDYIARKYAKRSKWVKYDKITGFAINSVCDDHWSQALAGKRVLVVSSFPISIEYQYERRQSLCKRLERCLPEFQLITYKSLSTQMGTDTEQYADWFEAYQKMREEILEIDFEIALIGCGAYGFPLAADIKRSGRTVLELCGKLPFLFGVYNSGFEKRYPEKLQQYKTDAWTKPIDSPVRCYKEIEGGSYW